jgi:hypothetical protein
VPTCLAAAARMLFFLYMKIEGFEWQWLLHHLIHRKVTLVLFTASDLYDLSVLIHGKGRKIKFFMLQQKNARIQLIKSCSVLLMNIFFYIMK